MVAILGYQSLRGGLSSIAASCAGRAVALRAVAHLSTAISKMKEHACDAVVIGAGPGGLPVSIALRKAGFSVVCIERMAHVGGCCVNEGCVPTKSMCNVTSLYQKIKDSHERGIRVEGVKLDLAEVHRQKDAARSAQQVNLEQLMLDAGVVLVKGQAKFVNDHEIHVTPVQEGHDEESRIKFSQYAVVATGSKPVQLPTLPFDHKKVLDSFDAVEMKKIPKSMVVVGAGVIALELGSVWARLGTQVTLVEMLPGIGSPVCDVATSAHARKIFEKQGLQFMCEHKVKTGAVTESGVEVTVTDAQNNETKLNAEVALVSVGRRPNTAELGLEAIGVSVNKGGYVEVDEHCRTSVQHIFAVGDVTNKGYMVAHKATMEGHSVSETICGRPEALRYDRLPCCVYTKPELAWCGKTESALKAEGRRTKSYIFHYHSNMRDPLAESLDGFVKVVTDADTNVILGLSAVGETAGDLVGEGVMALVKGATINEWGHVPHVHPFYKSFHTMYALGIYESS